MPKDYSHLDGKTPEQRKRIIQKETDDIREIIREEYWRNIYSRWIVIGPYFHIRSRRACLN